MLLSGDAKIFICRVECVINRRLEMYTSFNNSGNFWLHKIIKPTSKVIWMWHMYYTFFVTIIRIMLRSGKCLASDALFTLEVCKDTHQSTRVSVPSHSSLCRYNWNYSRHFSKPSQSQISWEEVRRFQSCCTPTYQL